MYAHTAGECEERVPICVRAPTYSKSAVDEMCAFCIARAVKWRVELAPMVTSTAHDGHCVKRHTSKRHVMAIGLKSSQRVRRSRVEW
jgi:hypothetical protein